MLAKDIMTTRVVCVSPDGTVGEAARLLLERRISAVPVLRGGRLVGIVSEGDLLHRYEIGTDRTVGAEAPWWERWFGDGDSPEDYVRSHARYVRDIMTRRVITASPESPLAQVARLLERHRVKRIPILRAGQLVGIVSRSDLVSVFARVECHGEAGAPKSDHAIREHLQHELRRHAWWNAELASVAVQGGVVTFGGVLNLEIERAAARVAAETIPGVRAVVDRRLAYRDLPSIT